MQKLVKRAAQAQKQAVKKAQQSAQSEQSRMRREANTRLRMANAEIKQNRRDARRAQKEDWELGPLAPKRDIGVNNYGMVTEFARMDWSSQGKRALKPQDVEKRCAWAGGATQLNLAVGDRVVILDGQDKGKIDRIKTISMPMASVTLEKFNQALAEPMLDQPATVMPVPLPIDAIRLVYPVADAITGVTRDVVINELRAVPPNMSSPNMSYERWEFGQKWDRLVPGLNVVIPWPETKAPEFTTTPADTVRDQVEDRTFHYGLLAPPMPPQVLNELRNPYSKFRTRHEPWYVAQKEAEEQMKKARLETVKSMQTPLDELHEKNRAEKAARGEPELSEEMLAKLGEFIAKKKTAALKDAGVSEVSSVASPAPPPTSSEATPPGPQ